MNIDIIENPTDSQMQFFEDRLQEFNEARWDVKRKIPLVVQIENNDGRVQAGAAAKTFGNWLLIENIWVSEELRGQKIGSQILESLEGTARARGCTHALLDTLEFQARPFYERFGYKVAWIQENYPKSGCKQFMTKEL